jgi:hypothetical protein
MKESNETPGDDIVNLVLASKEIQVLQDDSILQSLAAYLNHLILTDFEALVQLLYRIDVSEEKLKKLLRDNPEMDAGLMIAALIIERQKEKIISRSQNNNPYTGDNTAELW